MIVIGHRGAMGHAPENTLSSFSKALDLGVKHLELDVYQVDSQIIVFHDERLERVTNGVGYVHDHNFIDLRKLDAGNGEKIPTLQEVLELVDGRAAINIELKGLNTSSFVEKLIRSAIAQNSNWSEDKFLVSSFRHKELQRFSNAFPEIRRGALQVCDPIDSLGLARSVGAKSIHASLEFISEELIEEAHKAGLKVYIFTVNTMEDINKMYSLGVDGIFSNFPERAISFSYSADPIWL